MLWDLFYTFMKIGFISFGGGYAMIPVIEYEVHLHGWLTTQQFTDIVAIAGMSPGPIATNCAVFVGYTVAGMVGAIVSVIAISLPSLFLVLMIALFFYKMQKQSLVQSMLYGLRPVITGLICYAAIRFSIQNEIIESGNGFNFLGMLVLLSAFAVLFFTRVHPALVILFSGIVGIFLYY